MWLSRVPTYSLARAYPSSSLVVFCIFNLLIITHHSGRFCVMLANCFMVSFVKALLTRTTVLSSSPVTLCLCDVCWRWGRGKIIIWIIFAYASTFDKQTWATACFVVVWVGRAGREDCGIPSEWRSTPARVFHSVSQYSMALEWLTTEWILYLCIRSESLGSSVVAHQKITFYDTIHTLCAHFSLFPE